MKIRFLLLASVLGMFLAGCATPDIPKSFSRYNAPGWTSLEIRNDVPYDRAWNVLVALLARKFDLEFISRDEGYLRTAWLYTWPGVYMPNYRVRVTALFTEDRKTLQLKPEAQSLEAEIWVEGVDTRLLPSLKADLVGTIGRTLR